jgi:DNA-binding SARP family transcriptional activator
VAADEATPDVADPDAPVGAGLAVSLLGPLRVQRDGQEVVLGGPRPRAVLARLALAGGSVVGTDRIVDALWSDDPPPSAANTLQSYVSNLRRVLGPGVVERVGAGYRLVVPPERLDVVRFERLAAAGAPSSGRDPAERLALLDEALALWTGPAVVEFADEPWAQGDAVRLESLRMAALEERFEALLDLGRHAEAIGDLEGEVRSDPTRERFAGQLMVALYRSGRQAEALRAYDRTRRHLAEELGLDPGPELAALAARVLDQDPTLVVVSSPAPGNGSGGTSATGSTAGPSRGPAEPAVGPPVGPLDLPPAVVERRARSSFVGRGREVAELQAAYGLVEAGDRSLVVVTGEAGMGKTRLAQHVAVWAHDRGGHVLWGRCSADNLIAYQPAVEALRTALRSISAERAGSLLGPRPALAVLLPDLVDGGASGAGRADRFELYESLADLVGEVAESAPVVFVVDDIQWADRATLGLIEHLLHSDRTGRLLVVATQRRPAGRPTVELDAFYADLQREHRKAGIHLGGVGVEEVADLLGSQGVEVSGELAAALHARTGGNPFFVESLAEHGGDLARVDARELPDSVRELLDLRLAGLDPEAAGVLSAAAVVGMRVELTVLGAVAELEMGALLDVVDAALDAGLLAEDEQLGWVAFPHALVRQALVARTTRNREALLHVRVADAIEARSGVLDRHATVAQHLLAAGRVCPPERAARAAIEAGSEALVMLADDEARTWARRAASVVEGVAEGEAAALGAEAELLSAAASRYLGDQYAALASVGRVVAYARASGDGLRLARAAQEAALARAGVGFTFGVADEELLALITEGLAAVGDGAPAVRAALLAWSSIAQSGSDLPRTTVVADEAIEVARRLGDEPVLALAQLARRLALAGPAGLEERLTLGPEMVATAERAGWTELAVVGRVVRVLDTLESGDLAAATGEVERVAAAVAPLGRPALDAYELFLRANLAHLHGDLDGAEALSARGVEVGEPSHAGNARQTHYALQFLLARDRGRLGELAPLVDGMVEAFPRMVVWTAAQASCRVALGDPEGARAATAPIYGSGVLAAKGESIWYLATGQLAEVAWSIGDSEAGRALAGLLEPYADRLAASAMGAVCIGPVARHLGLALAAAGDLDGAVARLEQAVATCEADDLPIWGARARAELGLVLVRRGAPGDADRGAALVAAAVADATARGVHLALTPTEHPTTP